MPNPWRQFMDLLPDSPLLIGTVTATHTDDAVTVELLDGGSLRVRGTNTSGERVFVRDGEVVGPAPPLPAIDIEI